MNITELAQREKFEAWAEHACAAPWGYLKKRRTTEGYSEQIYTCMWTAWKAAGVELVEALEKAQQVDEELCRLLPPGVEYMDPPDGGGVTPLEQVSRMVANYRQRITELDAELEREREKSRRVMSRIAELESRTVTVKLPPKIERDYVDGWFSHKGGLVGGGAAEWYNKALDDVIAELAAQGIKVEAE